MIDLSNEAREKNIQQVIKQIERENKMKEYPHWLFVVGISFGIIGMFSLLLPIYIVIPVALINIATTIYSVNFIINKLKS